MRIRDTEDGVERRDRRPLATEILSLAGLAVLLVVACGRAPDASTSGEREAGAAHVQAATASVRTPSFSGLRDAGETRDSDEPTPAQAGQEVAASRTTAIVRASERVAPAVVAVNVLRTERIQARSFWEEFFLPPGAQRRTSGLGSGFIIDSTGIVLSNDHVVRGAERIMVTLPDGRDMEAELVGRDEVTDVAVLRIQGARLPVASLGTSKGLLIGEWAMAIGNPFGNLLSNAEPTVTLGVISAVDRNIVPSGQERGFYLGMIQTDASINPGNSGGPLVNALGEVIGVNSSIFTRSGGSEGLGFAIPIDRALRVADDLLTHGEVRRAWLGLGVEAAEADEFGRTRGVRVASVAPGSPAAEAGIHEGAHLLRAAGEPLSGPLDYESILLDLRPGDDVSLLLDGSRRPVTLRAEELPSLRAERVTVLEEMELVTLTPQIRAERGVQNESGAVIVEISDRLRSSLNLREGDVLLQINDSRIQSAEDAARALRSARGPVRIYFERNGSIVVRDFVWRR